MVTYINAERLELKDVKEAYKLDADTRLVTPKGKTIEIGGTKIANFLEKEDQVKVTKVDGRLAEEIVVVKAAAIDTKVGTLITNIDKIDDTTNDTTIKGYKATYDALEAYEQEYVTNYDKLEKALQKIYKKEATTAVNALFTTSGDVSSGLASGVTQDTIDNAQDLVDELKASDDKKALQAKIDKAQELLDGNAYDGKVTAATNAVNALFTTSGDVSSGLASGVTQDTIDNAQDLVDELKASDDKKALQAKIDKAQELLDIDEAETALAAADTTLKMRNFLEKYADVIGIDVTDAKYVANKDTVANEVLANITLTTATLDDVKTAFNDALALLD